MGPDGWFYMADARRGFEIKTKEGDSLKGKGARIWRCRPDGTGLESMSGGGFDNSVEIAFMPSGETLGTMTYFTDPQAGFWRCTYALGRRRRISETPRDN